MSRVREVVRPERLALVVESGEVVGLVTATDALESVMGDVEDPIDQGQVATS